MNVSSVKGYGFFRSQNIFFRFAEQQNNFFRGKLSRHYFFSTKTIIFKAQSSNRIFSLPISETEILFQSNLPTEIVSPQKTQPPPPLQVKWMFPKLKLRCGVCFFVQSISNYSAQPEHAKQFRAPKFEKNKIRLTSLKLTTTSRYSEDTAKKNYMYHGFTSCDRIRKRYKTNLDPHYSYYIHIDVACRTIPTQIPFNIILMF